ncbi:PIG-L family deacetylase [Kytococcus sp. Marseille-QA3725]
MVRSRRRFVLGVALAGLVPVAGCGRSGTLVVVTPHPDDETLRLSSYVLHARDRGDRLVLVAATRGTASSAAPASWNPEHLAEVRSGELEGAWAALTGGEGTITHLELPDGGLTESSVEEALSPVLDQHPGAVVAAACAVDDDHPDHRVVARVVRRLAGERGRTALPPGATGGRRWDCPDLPAARRADAAYEPFGHRSVSGLFADLRAARHRSAVLG